MRTRSGYDRRVSIDIAFTKGHGTGNDFVLFADPEGEIDLDAALAAVGSA